MPVVQEDEACSLSDEQWMHILQFYQQHNLSAIDDFIHTNFESPTVAVDATSLGRPQLSGCSLETRVLATIAWKLSTAPFRNESLDTQALARVKPYFAADAGSAGVAEMRRQLREPCVSKCRFSLYTCPFGIKVDWACVREKIRAAWEYMAKCGLQIGLQTDEAILEICNQNRRRRRLLPGR